MLSRRDPFRDMMSLQRTLDRLMESSLGEQGETAGANWGLALDVVENEDSYIVKASVPGINPDDIEITFNNGLLTIRGEMKDERETENGQYQLRERRFGSFSRSITLPTQINPDQIHANYENGVLKLALPKSEEVKPRRIPVRSEGSKVIEGNSKH